MERMVVMADRWHVIQTSTFPHEQEALDLLRQQLPDRTPFRAWANFEFIAIDGSINEVDALVISTDCIYLVEIKSWSGRMPSRNNCSGATATRKTSVRRLASADCTGRA